MFTSIYTNVLRTTMQRCYSSAASLPRTFFDIEISGKPVGRLVFELRSDVVPKTTSNFLALCTGEKGFGYKDSIFHRIIPGFMAQGGDFQNANGTGGYSIYGDRFEDENFDLKNKSLCLSMANAGPNTNGSQFFITFTDCEWLDGKHVVFGRLVEGQDVLQLMETKGSTPHGKTSEQVKISDCGSVEEQ
mmetsp:Transcript_8245/g.12540  ORF Transcript_8245/g.12540 Transcript_8245/m.12540 type:complete len:189 (+) Transcript_8245:45-611(+)